MFHVSCWYRSIHHLSCIIRIIQHVSLFIITTSIWHPQKYVLKKHIKALKKHQTATQANFRIPSSIGLLWTFAKPMTFAVSSRSNARPLMPNPAAEPKGFWSKTLILRGRVWKINSWNHHGLPPPPTHTKKKPEVWIWDDENLPEISWRMFFLKISSRWFLSGKSNVWMTGNWKSFMSVENGTSEW